MKKAGKQGTPVFPSKNNCHVEPASGSVAAAAQDSQSQHA
jgi:hypothetical protein